MVKLANKLPLFFSVVYVPMMVSAHHSNAEWDPNVKREFEGEVVNVVWRNTHVRLSVNGPTTVVHGTPKCRGWTILNRQAR